MSHEAARSPTPASSPSLGVPSSDDKRRAKLSDDEDDDAVLDIASDIRQIFADADDVESLGTGPTQDAAATVAPSASVPPVARPRTRREEWAQRAEAKRAHVASSRRFYQQGLVEAALGGDAAAAAVAAAAAKAAARSVPTTPRRGGKPSSAFVHLSASRAAYVAHVHGVASAARGARVGGVGLRCGDGVGKRVTSS